MKSEYLIRNKWKTGKKIEGNLPASDFLSLLLRDRYDLADELYNGDKPDFDKFSLDFKNPAEEILHDPFLLNDMDKAVDLIEIALRDEKNILIFGDYDADGVSATAIVYAYLQDRGARVSFLIPERLTHGYGISFAGIDSITDRKPDLLITVDNGISAIDEIAFLNDKGIDVIVTDHHECKDLLPPAKAVINPKRSDSTYPFRDLAGAGVALKLVQALSSRSKDPQAWKKFTDICTLGTVADMVALLDENRSLVFHGLKKINEGKNPGLRALADVSGINREDRIKSMTLAFALAPKINAAGRVGDSSKAVHLLLEKDPYKCLDIARELLDDNQLRQDIEADIFQEAKEMLKAGLDPLSPEALVLYTEDWHLGVLGIVASKLADHTGRTVFVFGGDEGTYKGSARSGDGLPVLDTIIYAKDFVESFGGHVSAAGLTVDLDKMEDFIAAVEEFSRQYHGDGVLAPEIKIDYGIDSSMLNMNTAGVIESLEPIGEGNPTPVFSLKGLRIDSKISLSNGKHCKLLVSADDFRPMDALLFGRSPQSLPFKIADTVDLAFTMNINEWRGQKSLQMLVKDIVSGDLFSEETDIPEEIFRKALSSNFNKLADLEKEYGKKALLKLLPSANDYGNVYRSLESRFKSSGCICDIPSLRDIINADLPVSLSAGALEGIIEIFAQAGIVEIEKIGDGVLSLKIKEVDKTVSLSDSEMYRNINGQGQDKKTE